MVKSLLLKTSVTFCLLIGMSMLSVAEQTQDEAILLDIHKSILTAFLKGDTDLLYRNVDSMYFNIANGSIEWKKRNISKKEMSQLFNEIHYSIYEDIKPPHVKVSQDGSLGWVLANVRIQGKAKVSSTPVQHISMSAAWIELYEKQDDKWVYLGSANSTSKIDQEF